MKAYRLSTVLFVLSIPCLLFCQDTPVDKKKVIDRLENKKDYYAEIAHQIWEYAELGYLEKKSSSLLQKTLSDAGFEVKSGVADIPTAFVGSYGSGDPVIGILAEYDALPGVSQEAVPYKSTRADCTSGHACGHHLFGTASVASAIAIKEWMSSYRGTGTIKVFGTPAEEGGSGKVYMSRAGLFDDVDAMLNWHPGDQLLVWRLSRPSFDFMVVQLTRPERHIEGEVL